MGFGADMRSSSRVNSSPLAEQRSPPRRVIAAPQVRSTRVRSSFESSRKRDALVFTLSARALNRFAIGGQAFALCALTRMENSPANAVLSVIKVLTPSAEVCLVPLNFVLPIGGEQLCYVKEPSGWKIAGFLGGEANQ